MNFLRKLFGKKMPLTKVIPPEVKQAQGFFSTHTELRSPSSKALIETYMDSLKDAALKAIPKLEGVALDDNNPIPVKTAYNTGQYDTLPEALFAWYVAQGFIGYQACAIIAQHWLVDKACSVAPADAVRKGYELTVNDGTEVPVEALDRLKQIDREHNIKKQLVEFAKFNRVFGIRIAIFHVESDDPDYYKKPFNLDGVKRGSYKGFSQIDPYWITPQLDAEAAADMASRHFYEPTWWMVNGTLYHRSHLVIIRTTDVADILKPSYIYAGIPLPQRIFERVYAAERTANEAPLLAMTKRTTVLKVDMDAVMADQVTFEKKLLTWLHYRDNQQVKVCGLNEELSEIDTSLTDLDDLIMTQYQIVSAIANTPSAKLLGTVPKGFNSTGDYEEATYHEYLETIQENEMTPLLKRHHELAIRSDLELEEYGVFSVEANWKPLDSLTETELADINLKKAQSAQALQMTGAVNGDDIRNALIADKTSGYNGLESEDAPVDDDDFTDEDLPDANAQAVETAPTSMQQEITSAEAFNGAQVSSMVTIVQSVAAGTLPRESGVAMLMVAFSLSLEDAKLVMSNAGEGFTIKPTTNELPKEPDTQA